MSFQLIDCETTILREITMPEVKRKDIAQTYRLIMESGESSKVDWGKINRAIIERWSKSGLIWIKQQAHSGKAFDDKKGSEA